MRNVAFEVSVQNIEPLPKSEQYGALNPKSKILFCPSSLVTHPFFSNFASTIRTRAIAFRPGLFVFI